MSVEIVAEYDMAEHAAGLAEWLHEAINGGIPRPDAMVVYVYDPQGGLVTGARVERELLTDGSAVYNVRLTAG